MTGKMLHIILLIIFTLCAFSLCALSDCPTTEKAGFTETSTKTCDPNASAGPFYSSVATAAFERTKHQVTYDPSYIKLSYPGGDVPDDRGVCTDVVVRVYRALGIDLQKLVHEDMKANFSSYPQRWGLSSPDSNIDHRRVPNLRAFFKRHGTSLPVSKNPSKYKAGDIVTWDLGGGTPHIGIVSDKMSADCKRPMVIHNINRGPKLEDELFGWKITGHYRYGGK